MNAPLLDEDAWDAGRSATPRMTLPVDSKERKEMPIYGGVLRYFPAALARVARLSKKGNDKHNPGQDLHWSRDKSSDHAECIARHLIDLDSIDPDSGEPHWVALAWRALAYAQLKCETEGAPMAPGARLSAPSTITREMLSIASERGLLP